jgi:DNA-binding sugar fermentation-stimulating protein
MSTPLHLVRGELVDRPNRFIFEGRMEGIAHHWHCPVTSSIGGIRNFSHLPCLVSEAEVSSHRRTSGTVEALSLDGGESWIGINQNRINGWMETLLRANAIPSFISCADATITHEVTIGDSRLDLHIQTADSSIFLELKTPIHGFILTPTSEFTRPATQAFFDRLIRHYGTLSQLARQGHRTIVALCFMYDAAPFTPPPRNDWNRRIFDTIAEARKAGVENYQINFSITPTELRITKLESLPFSSP